MLEAYFHVIYMSVQTAFLAWLRTPDESRRDRPTGKEGKGIGSSSVRLLSRRLGAKTHSFLLDAQRQPYLLGTVTGNLSRGYAAEVFFQIPIDFVSPLGIL